VASQRRLGLTGRRYLELLAGRTEECLAVHITYENELMLALAAGHGACHVGDLEPFPGWPARRLHPPAAAPRRRRIRLTGRET